MYIEGTSLYMLVNRGNEIYIICNVPKLLGDKWVGLRVNCEAICIICKFRQFIYLYKILRI